MEGTELKTSTSSSSSGTLSSNVVIQNDATHSHSLNQNGARRRTAAGILVVLLVLLELLLTSSKSLPRRSSDFASSTPLHLNHEWAPVSDGVIESRTRHLRRESTNANLWRRLQDEVDASNNNDSSTSCNLSCCSAFVNELCPTDSSDDTDGNAFAAVSSWAQILLIIFLLCCSALVSGLTLGLLSLDKAGLEIVMSGDDPENARYAKRIYPIRKNGNQLLCTLVLVNVGVNSLLSILMADKAGGLVGFLVSTFAIVIFAEIIPQSICSLHALRIGSATAPIVRAMMIVLFPIAFPLGYMMDRVLGEELTRSYSSSEMLKLLEIQVNAKRIDQDTATAMTGALMYKNTTVSQIMTPIENTFMLEVDDRLSFETVAKIFKTGYSRIPVYEIDRNYVVGLLFVKDLIFIDPEDNTRVGVCVELFGRSLHVVWADDKLGDVLRDLKSGHSHMALVREVNNASDTSDPFYELKGIVTLEDIIEEIIGDEIVDETDAYVDGSQLVVVDRPELARRWASLRMLDSKIVDETLSFEEVRAMAAHISKNFSHLVELLSYHQLQKLLSETPISILPVARMSAGQFLPDNLLYKKGEPSDVCTVIVSGKATVIAGADQFRSDVSSWSLLGVGALGTSLYTPDFSAFVSNGPFRCLRVSRARFSAAVEASALERHANSNPPDATPESNCSGGGSIVIRGSTTRKAGESSPPSFPNKVSDVAEIVAVLKQDDSHPSSPTRTHRYQVNALLAQPKTISFKKTDSFEENPLNYSSISSDPRETLTLPATSVVVSKTLLSSRIEEGEVVDDGDKNA